MSIYEIIMTVLTVVFGGLALYIQTKKKLTNNVTGAIDEAEEVYKDTTKAGGSKHQYVIEKLYAMIPAPLKVFITKEMVESIVDKAFDEIESYAKKQLDKVVDKIVPETKPVETPVVVPAPVVEPTIPVTTETDVK